MKCNLGNVIACLLWSRDQLENREDEDEVMSGWVWKAIEDSTEKTRVEKAKEKRGKIWVNKIKRKDRVIEERKKKKDYQ